MITPIKLKNCPCSKSEYCTNGLKCTDQNCFLLKGSTFVTRSMAMPIEALTYLYRSYSLITDRASHYIHLNTKGSYDSALNKSGDSAELSMPWNKNNFWGRKGGLIIEPAFYFWGKIAIVRNLSLLFTKPSSKLLTFTLSDPPSSTFWFLTSALWSLIPDTCILPFSPCPDPCLLR